MKRAALLCLLALTACQGRDPDGTLQPDETGRTGEIVAPVGDSRPFRLSGGDMAFDVGIQPAEAFRECAAQARLIRYGETDGLPFGTPSSIFQTVTVNALEPGVYFFRTEAGQSNCRLIVYARPN